MLIIESGNRLKRTTTSTVSDWGYLYSLLALVAVLVNRKRRIGTSARLKNPGLQRGKWQFNQFFGDQRRSFDIGHHDTEITLVFVDETVDAFQFAA